MIYLSHRTLDTSRLHEQLLLGQFVSVKHVSRSNLYVDTYWPDGKAIAHGLDDPPRDISVSNLCQEDDCKTPLEAYAIGLGTLLMKDKAAN